MRGKFFFFIAFLFLFLTSTTGFSQQAPRDQLDRLRAEVDSLQSVLNQYAKSEKDVFGKIRTLDQQISTRKRLISELARNKKKTESDIREFDRRIRRDQRNLRGVKDQLTVTSSEIQNMQALISRRAIHLYKHGARQSLRFLTAATSPGDFLRRRIYVSRITERDQHNLELLKQTKTSFSSQQRTLEKTLARLAASRASKAKAAKRLEKLAAEAKQTRTKLEKDRRAQNNALANLKKDKASVAKILEERKAAIQQVENWIAALERERAKGDVQEINARRRPSEIVVRPVQRFDTFAKARGQLPWPVKGRVVTRFGLVRNKVTGTKTENPGVDISASEGAEVLAVQGGTCKRITYLRGFGTTVIIGHKDGYYTVYSHLGDVWLSEGEPVEAGRVIGTVGTPGDNDGTRLHFQVWHKRKKEDPQHWLRS